MRLLKKPLKVSNFKFAEYVITQFYVFLQKIVVAHLDERFFCFRKIASYFASTFALSFAKALESKKASKNEKATQDRSLKLATFGIAAADFIGFAMTAKRIFIIFAAIVVTLISPVFSVGTTGASLLKQFVGARAPGMGEAYTAVADDIYALHYNYC